MAYTQQTASASGSKISKKKAREIEGRVKAMIFDALRFHESELSPFRIKAGKFYRGELPAPEGEGRSKVVLTELRDAVLQQMPSLMRVFFGPDGAVEFVPRRPDAVDLAEQQTDYVNYVFAEQNAGFFVLYSAFKDALVRRIGIIKCWWEEKDCIASERLSGVTEEGLTALSQTDPALEISDTQENEDGTLTVVTRKKYKRGMVRVEAVPPEEFIYNRSARSLDDAVFVAHVTIKTVGELIALGYDRKDIESIGQNALLTPSTERDARRPQGATAYDVDESNTGENQKVSYVEAYVKMDFGDGIEHKKMCFVGNELKKINEEPAPDRPFVLFTPDPEPHEMQGLSISDMSMDLQNINSHVARAVLNSLNLSLQPRTVFNSDMVNVKDLMNVEIGANIRTQGDPNTSVAELRHTFVGGEGLGVLEFFKTIKEERLGTPRAAVGLDPDALQSSTAQAVDATVSRAEARTELLARIFAENMKMLFRLLYNLVRRNQQQPVVARLRGRYVTVDPASWPEDPDVSVRVGLGGGTKQEKVAYLQATAEKQESVMQLLGPNNKLTDIKLYRNTLAEGSKLLGFDPGRTWKEVTEQDVAEMDQAAQQQPQQGDAATQLAQAQIQNDQQRVQQDAEKASSDLQLKQMELQLKREQMMLEDQRERAKIEADVALRARELELKYKATVDTAAIQAQVDRELGEIQHHTELGKTAIETANQPPEDGDTGE